MKEREPRYHLHVIDRAAQAHEDRFNREYHLTVAGIGHFSAQVLFPHGSFALTARASFDGDDLVQAQASVPPLGLHLGFSSRRLASRLRKTIEALGIRVPSFEEYEVGLRIHDWALWWSGLAPTMSWSSGTPWWRQHAWHPFGFPGERLGEETLVDERDAELALSPTELQACHMKLTRARHRSTRFPLLAVASSHVWFDFKPPVDTGHRKGPTWGMGVNADSFEDALYAMRVRILTERVKTNWRPPVVTDTKVPA